jgi:hypothetical protein
LAGRTGIAVTPKGEHLFPQLNKAQYGENRRLRPLFLPALLKDGGADKRLKGAEQDRAYEIICKWADIESSGKLDQMKETAIEGEFCKEVFGDALGYTFFADNKDHWNFQPKYSVNGGTADAAIGTFKAGQKHPPRVLIELKGPKTNVDKDRSQGRTPVQQCWDYLNAIPKCPWGIVCNYVSFRLYHKEHTPRIYELFVLQKLKDRDEFNQFYYLFHCDGFIPKSARQPARADQLLERSVNRERQVGDELYKQYHDERIELISYLTSAEHNFPLEKAIRVTQKLLDRIIFVAFCEDRELLPGKSLLRAWRDLPAFHRVTNPRWQNYLNLFRSIDKGNTLLGIPPYNGGLFREDAEVDELQLDDDRTDFFKNVGGYDFAHEINVDVLGHIFEKSINDIDTIRQTGIFEAGIAPEDRPKMLKSAERKRGGIYYTPPDFTDFITGQTVGKLADDKIEALERNFGVRLAEIDAKSEKKRVTAFAENAIDELREIKVVDPACGSGAFLICAYQALEDKYVEVADVLAIHDPIGAERIRDEISDYILHDNLYGVDLSQEAVEITQLALWLRSAHRGKTLADLSKNIIQGNSLVSDPEVDEHAFDWREKFPDVFSRPDSGFDCVIGNPPWERLNLKKREFFDRAAPHLIKTANAAEFRKLVEKLEKDDPNLHRRYVEAKAAADNTIAYVRKSGRYQLTSKGDINTYAVFAELAHSIVSPRGRVGLLVPTGIATDKTNEDFFGELVKSHTLSGLYDFENRKKIFPDVDGRYKFSVLLFGGSKNKSKSANFVFFAHKMPDLNDKKRQISLSAADFKLLNPNTQTCPIFRSARDANLTKYVYKQVPILISESSKQHGNPWGIAYMLMFHQSFDASLFHEGDTLQKKGYKLRRNEWVKGKQKFLPLYEAKMIQAYDHRAASAITDKSKWGRQGQTIDSTLVEHQNSEFVVMPRWWVDESEVKKKLNGHKSNKILAFKNVTSPTNQRTMIISFIPQAGVIHSAPLMLTGPNISHRLTACLLANMNSFIYDYICRQKIGGVNLSYFIINQLPTFPPDTYSEYCPWDRRVTLEKWISDRVLKLTCTSNDMIPLAKAAGFKPPVHKWKESERLDLMAELDAAYFLLYGIERDDVEYILSTFAGLRNESPDLLARSTTTERILAFYDEFKSAVGPRHKK